MSGVYLSFGNYYSIGTKGMHISRALGQGPGPLIEEEIRPRQARKQSSDPKLHCAARLV